MKRQANLYQPLQTASRAVIDEETEATQYMLVQRICIAQDDATGCATGCSAGASRQTISNQKLAHMRAAIDYIFTKDGAFDDHCELIGVNPEYIRYGIKKKMLKRQCCVKLLMEKINRYKQTKGGIG